MNDKRIKISAACQTQFKPMPNDRHGQTNNNDCSGTGRHVYYHCSWLDLLYHLAYP